MREVMLLLLMVFQQTNLLSPSRYVDGNIVSLEKAPTELKLAASHWSVQKREYVSRRATSMELLSEVLLAEKTSGIRLTRQSRTTVALEYAAAEYDLRELQLNKYRSSERQQSEFEHYMSTESASDPHSQSAFVFRTREPTVSASVRTYAQYGRLKLTLKPPVDTYSVTIDEDRYDASAAFMLLVGKHKVIVERGKNDSCAGDVTIEQGKTQEFACHPK